MTQIQDLPAPQDVTVFVPVTGGVVLGEAYWSPWLTADLAKAVAAIYVPWRGQPVFADDVTAWMWVTNMEDANPLLNPWTVEKRQGRIVTYTDDSTRLFLQ
jgi:hypothetical protein